ncbi:MAG: ribosome silencing factor [Clostridia bacterium]|nr:ribosome silencing factor [Clostridia bacterium]
MNCDKIIDIAANTLNDKKAINISAIHIGEITVIAEYFILATATSNTHVKALADAVEEKLKAEGIMPDHIEGKATGWILMDYNGVVIHIFSRETREFYDLDRMWDDGDKIDLDKILKSEREED